MILVDNNGITFETPDFDNLGQLSRLEPNYVIWFEPDRLSCNLHYVMPVHVLGDDSDTLSVEVPRSEVFKLIDPNLEIPEPADDLPVNATVDFSKTIYYEPDAAIVPGITISVDGNEKKLFTFYIVAEHDQEETVLCDIILNLNNTETKYSKIRIGATFYGECEELTVAAANMGIKLPADICKAFWGCNFHEYHPDRVMERDKLKELLFNYMGIRGECGNYNSAIQSFKWFGWGDKLTLSQLVSINKELSNIYLNDYFNIYTDIPVSFKNFYRSTLLSIKLHIQEFAGLGEERQIEFDSDSMEPLYDHPSENGPQWKWNDKIFGGSESSWVHYYDYLMNELALKLACLAELYEKYFLPVQLNVLSSSVVEHVTAVPFKILTGTYQHYNVMIDNVSPKSDYPEFNKTNFVIRQERDESYLDIDFNIVSEHKSGSCWVYISTDNGELAWNCQTGWDNGTVHLEIPVSELLCHPETLTNIAVLIDGIWYQEQIKVRYPKIQFTLGRLIYKDSMDAIESEFFLTNKYENGTDVIPAYTSENIDVYIPVGKQNLIATIDTTNNRFQSIVLTIDGERMSEYFNIHLMHYETPEETKYFYQIISRYPIEELDFNDDIYNWMGQKHDVGLNNNSYSVKFQRRWIPANFKFIPVQPDNDGWINNIFNTDDIIACKVNDEYNKIPYLSANNHRFTFKCNNYKNEIYSESGLAIMQRPSIWNPKNIKGYYSVTFSYRQDEMKNIVIDKPNLFKII